jgi:FRG domain
MPRTPRWTNGQLKNGVIEVKLSGWRWFSDYVNQELLDYTTYIYRGHGDSSWELEPTLDRIIKSPTSPRRKSHLENFMMSTRGRRGPNPPSVDGENGWWALGQHHGLATPLLDWTESPFVALYFAVADRREEPSTPCCVWALSQARLREKNRQISEDSTIKPISGRKPIIEIVRPLSDENGRLVNQRGLFTRGPNNIDIEQWITEYSKDDKYWNLIKIVIPTTNSRDCLRYLNRMNINHSTLFPDLFGASHFCNMDLQIPKY